jgi:hypothetical protein
MALADPFVNIPSGTRPASFEADSENYHNVQLPAKIQEIAAAALAMSLNSVQATSTTSMLIGTGAKTLTIQTNKSFLAGMDIRVVDAANPTVNYVNAVVTSYVIGTGAFGFTVPAGQAFGSGTLTNWVVFQTPAGGATNTFVHQLVQNQSANSAVAGGTATVATATPSPAYGAVAARQRINLGMPNAANGVAMTLQLGGQAALPCLNQDGSFVSYPANYKADWEINEAATTWILKNPPAKPAILSITGAVGASALTITINPVTLDFRATPLTSGTVNSRSISTAISMIVSSGSTLGTVNAVKSRIAVLAIDNAGTVEVACVNLAGGNDLSETGLINTTAEGGAGAADSANVIYSTTARTGVPYRVVGYIESTQTTAGTWAAAPSTIQGTGGEANTAMSSIGYGQTWQTVTRTSGTTYYNDTGKPIMWVVSINPISSCTATIGGVTFPADATVASVAIKSTFIIPPSVSYSWTGSGTITHAELR